MKTIGIIGHGYVGGALDRFFNNHFNCLIFDPKYFGIENIDRVVQSTEYVRYLNDPLLAANVEELQKADLFVLAVPTPQNEDHAVDLSFVRQALSYLPAKGLVLIKSAIPPGTVDLLKKEFDLRITVSPEYIGEGKYVIPWWLDKGYPHPTDMKYHNFHLVGGDRKDSREVLEFFKAVAGPDPRYVVGDAKTVELCKYMENSWGATKVTFANEFYGIAEAMGVDYDELREMWLLDGRVERMHTAVFKDKRGFGGKCFPKDVNGIVQQSKAAGYTPKLLEAVLSVNEEIKSVAEAKAAEIK